MSSPAKIPRPSNEISGIIRGCAKVLITYAANPGWRRKSGVPDFRLIRRDRKPETSDLQALIVA
jgi:hypothetical protein